jgi:hypothetical protein
MFGSAAMEPASQFSRTADQDYIHQLDYALYARKIRHITKFRVDGNVTHSLVASLRLSCENRSGSHRVNFADSIHKPRWSFRYTPVLYWGRSRFRENHFTYPGILSLELESLYEKERTFVSPRHVELLRSIRRRKINEIRTVIPVATVRSIAIAAHARELSIIYPDKRGSYDNFIHDRRDHGRMQASR